MRLTASESVSIRWLRLKCNSKVKNSHPFLKKLIIIKNYYIIYITKEKLNFS